MCMLWALGKVQSDIFSLVEGLNVAQFDFSGVGGLYHGLCAKY